MIDWIFESLFWKLPSPPKRGRGVGSEGVKKSQSTYPLIPTPLPRARGRGAFGADSEAREIVPKSRRIT
jgi:hypothetical protein